MVINNGKNFYVEWTGGFPRLCSGEWIIKYRGQILELPDNIKHMNMNTLKTHQKVYFDEDFIDRYKYIETGLSFDTWLEENKSWITEIFNSNNIPMNLELIEELYHEIQSHDWIHGSCGGCI